MGEDVTHATPIIRYYNIDAIVCAHIFEYGEFTIFLKVNWTEKF